MGVGGRGLGPDPLNQLVPTYYVLMTHSCPLLQKTTLRGQELHCPGRYTPSLEAHSQCLIYTGIEKADLRLKGDNCSAWHVLQNLSPVD